MATDIHDWLFYGEEETPKVANRNPDQGTNLAYKFATICIVDSDVRFTLDCRVLEDGSIDELAAAVRQLVSIAREYVTLNHVYCDRELDRVDLVATFGSSHQFRLLTRFLEYIERDQSGCCARSNEVSDFTSMNALLTKTERGAVAP